MSNGSLAGVLVAGLLALMPHAPPVVADASEERVQWMTDLEAAEGAARQTGKPLFIVFR